MQLDIFAPPLRPGLYTCTVAWCNSMGYTWKPGERVHLLRLTPSGFPWCATPEGLPHGCGFEMNEHALRHHFALTVPA